MGGHQEQQYACQERDFPKEESNPDKIPNRTKCNDSFIYTGVTFPRILNYY